MMTLGFKKAALSQLTNYPRIYQNSKWGKTKVKLEVLCPEVKFDYINNEVTEEERKYALVEAKMRIPPYNYRFAVNNRNWFAKEFKLLRFIKITKYKKRDVFENLEFYRKPYGALILLISLNGDEYDEIAKKVGLHKTKKLHTVATNSYYKEFRNKSELTKFFDGLHKSGFDIFKSNDLPS